MRRVVVDPGVLVSAIITPLGPPSEIVRAIEQGRLALVVSPRISSPSSSVCSAARSSAVT